MNYGTMRSAVRALIQERTVSASPRWTDARVNEAIDNRYFEAQNRVNRVRPGYFDTLAYITLTSGVSEYARPFFKPVLSYGRLAGDGSYVDCVVYSWTSTQPPAEHEISRIFQPSVYAVVEFGQSIIVYPTPTANLALGLRVASDYATSMTADADVPRVRTETHWRLVNGAAAELLDDDPTYPAETKAKLRSDFDYIFSPEPESLKRLCRLYPLRTMSRLTMEPPTNILTGQFRRLLNGGTTILY